MGKYDPLHAFLEDVEAEITDLTLTFDRIETILGDRLPVLAVTDSGGQIPAHPTITPMPSRGSRRGGKWIPSTSAKSGCGFTD